MSILKKLQTAQHSGNGWNYPVYFYISTLRFPNYIPAVQAFQEIYPAYCALCRTQTYNGIMTESGKPPADCESISFQHDLWIDEDDSGIYLCISFDNYLQRNLFNEDLRRLLPQHKIKNHAYTIREDSAHDIRIIRKASHYIDIGIPAPEDKYGYREKIQAIIPPPLYIDITHDARDTKILRVFCSNFEDAQATLEALKAAELNTPSPEKLTIHHLRYEPVQKTLQKPEKTITSESLTLPCPVTWKTIAETTAEHKVELTVNDGLDTQTVVNSFMRYALQAQMNTLPGGALNKLQIFSGSGMHKVMATYRDHTSASNLVYAWENARDIPVSVLRQLNASITTESRHIPQLSTKNNIRKDI